MSRHETIFVNGTSIYYEHAGEGKPVILVHGNGGSHEIFHVAIEQLVNSGYHVYALDSRGQGQNPPLNEYHYSDMAEDVFQFMQALNLYKPAYYGFSDGGIIGLQLLIAHPDSISCMIGSGANIRPEGALPEVVSSIESEYTWNPKPLLKLMIDEPHISHEELGRIQVPVLLTSGQYDVILHEHTNEMVSHIPGCEVLFLEGENHGSYIEYSDKIAPIILNFMKKNNY